MPFSLSSYKGLKRENVLPFESSVAVNGVLPLCPYPLTVVLILINNYSVIVQEMIFHKTS